MPVSCRRCAVEFPTLVCYKRHIEGGEKSICHKYWQCRQCRRYYLSSKVKPDVHICGHYYCKVCEKQVSNVGHRCYQRSTKENKKPCQTMIFFDFECTQDEGEHIPNLVVARRYVKGQFTEHVFRSDHVRDAFGGWLFSRQNKNSTVMAHNMKGLVFIFI